MTSVGARWFVVVNGPPGSGKSSIAPAIAAELGLPVVAKDVIKEALMGVLPVPDVDTSRRLGHAASRAMLEVAAASPIGAVLESNFYRSFALDELRTLPGQVIEVFCRCERHVALRRYRSRRTRHAGHFDQERTDAALWSQEVSEPVNGGWPLVEVDTNTPVDVPALARRLRDVMRAG
jgi:chloramphenicol 3-O-phosphotransferase